MSTCTIETEISQLRKELVRTQRELADERRRHNGLIEYVTARVSSRLYRCDVCGLVQNDSQMIGRTVEIASATIYHPAEYVQPCECGADSWCDVEPVEVEEPDTRSLGRKLRDLLANFQLALIAAVNADAIAQIQNTPRGGDSPTAQDKPSGDAARPTVALVCDDSFASSVNPGGSLDI